jgi:hypothetical protein
MLGFLFLVFASPAHTQPPLHQQIDLAAAADEPALSQRGAPLASDEEFLRRIYLDLTGTIPTAEEARAFLKDSSGDKRRRLIDRLLASPEHARHLAQVFDVALMERRQDKHVPRAAWEEYLRSSFAANKPWDVLAREILSADGADSKLRPAAKFYLDRDGEPNLITRDISRLFLGMNLQCAQCHDHPLVEEYRQEMYYGLFAFLNRSFLVADKKLKLTVFAEKAEGEATYQSVFDPKKETRTGKPRVPGRMPIQEPGVAKGKEYVVAPAKDVAAVPTFSRRAKLAAQVASPDNVRFRRNIANRLWALMTGRGLVHPVDLDHPANPPSHPKLLSLLADAAAAAKFDLRNLLREIALSQTYQRSSEQPAGVEEVPAASLSVARLRPLSAEQLAAALMQATGFADAERKALGKNATEAARHARLAPQTTPFVRSFGGKPGEPQGRAFEPTLDQTLFLANGPVIRGWLAPRPGNLTDRLARLSEPDAVAEELYLSILTRRPSVEERTDVREYLKHRSADRSAALQELAWALVASVEFRFNH